MPPAPGRWRTSVSAAGTVVHNEHFADENGRELVHVQDLTSSDVTSVLALGVARNLGLEWVQPWRRIKTTIRFQDVDRRPLILPDGDIHHRNETLTGPGDPWLTAVYGRTRGVWSFAARGGVSVPLGRTEENPFRLGREGLPHEHIQFGTGTWDPLLGLAAGRRLGKVAVSLGALARLPVSTNEHGYRAGRRYTVSASGDRPLGTGRWRLRAGLDLLREDAETWDGVVETEGNLGRTDLLAAAGVSRVLGPAGAVSLTVNVPLVTRANGAQLDYPLIVGLGWSR
jgi:hypothetical protein